MSDPTETTDPPEGSKILSEHMKFEPKRDLFPSEIVELLIAGQLHFSLEKYETFSPGLKAQFVANPDWKKP